MKLTPPLKNGRGPNYVNIVDMEAIRTNLTYGNTHCMFCTVVIIA